MYGPMRCKTCRQELDYDDFDFNRSTRRRDRECKVCRNLRLAKKHRTEMERYQGEAARLLTQRKAKRAAIHERIVQARAAAGKD